MTSPRISSLHIYPLKGGRGLEVTEVDLDRFGPVDDRRWMLVDSGGNLMTQREVAELCLVRALPQDGGVHLSKPGAGELLIPVPDPDAPRRTVRVWNDRFEAIDLGGEAADWCSAALGHDVGLVHLPHDATRRTDPDWDPEQSPVGFADGYPLLVIGAASLDDLNHRLPAPVPMSRFRPTMVIAGSGPHEEDTWRRFAASDVPFEGVKLCARCVVTTIDQQTAVQGVEPLRTLARYRKHPRGVMFGMNAVHRGSGRLRVGAPVTVSDRWLAIPV